MGRSYPANFCRNRSLCGAPGYPYILCPDLAQVLHRLPTGGLSGAAAGGCDRDDAAPVDAWGIAAPHPPTYGRSVPGTTGPTRTQQYLRLRLLKPLSPIRTSCSTALKRTVN